MPVPVHMAVTGPPCASASASAVAAARQAHAAELQRLHAADGGHGGEEGRAQRLKRHVAHRGGADVSKRFHLRAADGATQAQRAGRGTT